MFYLLFGLICTSFGFFAAISITKNSIQKLHKKIELLETIISTPYDYKRYDEIINENIERRSFEEIYCNSNAKINWNGLVTGSSTISRILI